MATKENMTPQSTTSADVKAVAKSIGGALRRQGHEVPHSHVLHAVAAALAGRDWHTLKARAAKHYPAPPDVSTAVETTTVSDATSPLDSFTDRTKFLLRLAVLAGTPVECENATDAEMRERALKAIRRRYRELQFSGVLKAGIWAMPADLNLVESVIDVGGFELDRTRPAMFNFSVGGHSLQLEAVYSTSRGWGPTERSITALFRTLEKRVPDATLALSSYGLAVACGFDPVMAQFWTDGRDFEVDFDCTFYLAGLSTEGLRRIIKAEFTASGETDLIGEAAGEFSGCSAQTDIKNAFAFLESVNQTQSRDPLGFDVRVNAEQMLVWLAKYRPVDFDDFNSQGMLP